MTRRILFLALATLVLGAGCTQKAPPTPEIEVVEETASPIVRVAILTQVREVHIGSNQSYTLSDDDGVLVVGLDSESFNVRLEKDRILVFTQGGELLDSVEGFLHMEPRTDSGEVFINGARYPQKLEIYLNAEGTLNAVNLVDVETYLRGVVPLEIGHQNDGYLEAAKAQAVAARTYVAGHMNQYAGERFDLFSGVTDQVYGPIDRRHPNADRAVAETRGKVLFHGGKPIRANYASTCGGKTAGVEESFGSDSISYLRSHDDRLGDRVACRLSKYYRWEETWTGPEITEVVSKTIPRVLEETWKGNWVLNVAALETGKSGRIVKLGITTDQGEYVVEKGLIRQVLESTSGRPLRSTSFELELWHKGERIRMMVARGRGWGHGVGMCQYGAMQLSQEGHGYQEILRHYYPGAKLQAWSEPSAFNSGETHTRSRVDG